MRRLLALVWLATLLPASARADGETTTLRMATMAPAGTLWAREFNAFAREVESQTQGAVHIKWYFGGIAGDEPAMGQRLQRGQIDGVASGGPLCEHLAPSMRVLRVVGLLTSTREADFLNHRLWVDFEREFRRSGVVPLGTVPVGPHILFTRRAVRSVADLRHTRLWVWDKDDVLRAELEQLQVPIVPLPVEQAGDAYDEGRVDGFIAPPTVALGFQWSARARYVTDLRLDFFSGCVVFTQRAFDPLSAATQAAIRSAAAKLGVRFTAVSQDQDDALLGGLFARQGLELLPPSPAFAAEFHELARTARDALDEKLVPHELLMRVLGILADYRVQH